MAKRQVLIGATTAAVLAVGGVGIATAVTYHSGWPPARAHAVAPTLHTSTGLEQAMSTGTTVPAATVPAATVPATAVPPTATPATTAPTTVPPTTVPAAAAPPASQAPITYTVKPGDNLSVIAAWFKLHGYQALYQANESVIGANPNLIFPGQTITLGGAGMTLGG